MIASMPSLARTGWALTLCAAAAICSPDPAAAAGPGAPGPAVAPGGVFVLGIDGVDPDTRWWCMTVYQDQFFIPNMLDRYSYSKTDVERNSDGSWTIKISAEEQSGSWIPLGEATGAFHLTFRCYNPGDSMIEQGEVVQLPVIVREETP